MLYEDFVAEIFLFTCLFYANNDDCITLLSSSFVDKEIEDDVDKMEFDEIVIGSDVLGTRFVDDDKIDWELFIISFIFLYILHVQVFSFSMVAWLKKNGKRNIHLLDMNMMIDSVFILQNNKLHLI